MPWFLVESGDMSRVEEAATAQVAVTLALRHETDESEDGITYGLLASVIEVVPHAEMLYMATTAAGDRAGIDLVPTETEENPNGE